MTSKLLSAATTLALAACSDRQLQSGRSILAGIFLLTALVPEVPTSLPQNRRSLSAIPGPDSLPFLLIFLIAGRA
jgi:hypothetical protein